MKPEKKKSTPIVDEIEIEDVEEDADTVHVEYDIASYPSDFTLSVISQMYSDNDITIPEYQRKFVWSIKQSSLLIDSFLCGLPVPPVFFYIDEENKNIVIDGQQRILSIVYYLKGYFGEESGQGKQKVFRLFGLSEKSPYYNKKFSELLESDQRKLKQAVLRAVNIKQLKPAKQSTSAYYIFERLNTGGTPLKPQEIRNCIYISEFNENLKSANRDSSWRAIIGAKNSDKFQKDVELILRIFALSYFRNEYEKPMKEFLNRIMKKEARQESAISKKFFEVFPQVCKIIIDKLGDKPFHPRGRINLSTLDSTICTLIAGFDKLDVENLKVNFHRMEQDSRFESSTTTNTTDLKTVNERFDLVKEYLLKTS